MSHAAPALELTNAQRDELLRISRSQTLPHRQVRRALALLDAADGVANEENARRRGVRANTVRVWRREFAERGLEGFGAVAPGRGRRPSIPQAVIDRIVTLTTTSRPEGRTHWSCSSMARETGVSRSTVNRIWRELGLKPHLTDSFKVSNDPRFDEKVADVVGLYVDPPEHAVVLCVDEKSQIQALDRTQPGLPMVPGRAGTMTHDYKRNGTTTLFAALDVATGRVIGECMGRHRHDEYLRFLRTIDRTVPAGLDVHVIADNYATHKHAAVRAWIGAHPRFHVHYTPTSSSWLNQVEHWFGDLERDAIRRGVFPSLESLVDSINRYIEANNRNPRPYTWTASAETILTKVKHAKEALNHSTKNETDH